MRAEPVLHAGQVAAENIIAGIAAIMVHIGPRLAELRALIAGLRRTALHLQGAQHARSRLTGTGIVGGLGGSGALRLRTGNHANGQQDGANRRKRAET